MPELKSCAGCGGTLWQEANGEPRFCDACLGDGTAEGFAKAAEEAEKAAQEAKGKSRR